MDTVNKRIEAALKAGWTNIRADRSYADGIPPGSPKPHPFGAHNYQELPAELDGFCHHCGNAAVEKTTDTKTA
jgi:FMN phosphatase YigB (HAD superfamily)